MSKVKQLWLDEQDATQRSESGDNDAVVDAYVQAYTHEPITEHTPPYYLITLEDGTTFDIDDLTQALSNKLPLNAMTAYEAHIWMEAIQYVLRMPFKGYPSSDAYKATTRLAEFIR